MTVLQMREKSDLAYWFPKLVQAGVPVPRTQIIQVEEEPYEWMAWEERNMGRQPKLTKLEADLDLTIASEFEYPCFLRTGQTSGKHDFENCCLVQSSGVLGQRIRNLIEFSAMVDMLGLSCKTWAVRELLPVDPVCTLPRYGNMPLVPEQRCFVSGGRLVCRHSYWPGDREEIKVSHKGTASIVEGTALFGQFLSVIRNLFGDNPKFSGECLDISTSGPLGDHDGLAKDIRGRLHAFLHQDNQFSLPSLDPQKRNEDATYLGCLPGAYLPAEQGFAILATGLNPSRGSATKSLPSEVYPLGLDLLYGESGSPTRTDLVSLSQPGRRVRSFHDKEGPVGVKKTGKVSNCLWIVFHEVKSTDTSTSGNRIVCQFVEIEKTRIPGAIAQGFPGNVVPAEQAANILKMDLMPPDLEMQFYLAVTKVAAAFEGDGNWSVDMLLTKNGWFVTDCAVAELSYHWPGCTKMEKVR